MTRRLGTVQRERDERGVVAVWLAIMLVMLLVFAAWAIDFAHWNDEKAHMQKAADAAALAGAVYLPDDPAGAFAAARSVAAKNGYSSGVSPRIGATSNQLVVTINRSVENSFAKVIGIGQTSISRHAVGEYESPQPLDLVVIIDRTSSMTATDLANVKNATRDVLGYLDPPNEAVALGVTGPSNPTTACTGANAGGFGVAIAPATAGTWLAAPWPLAGPSTNYQTATGALNTGSQLVRTVACLNTSTVNTNLAAPIDAARTYLAAYGRAGAKRGILFMTDGEANIGSTQPCLSANNAATAAKAAGIQIVTIGFGVSGARCLPEGGTYSSATVTRLLSNMASPINGVPAGDNGCTVAENADGDNFFCEPKSADLSKVFLQAAAQLAGRLPRIIE